MSKERTIGDIGMKRKKMKEFQKEHENEPQEKKSRDDVDNSEEVDREIRFYGDGLPTSYEESFNQFMAKVIEDSPKYSNLDFHNVGGNLIFFMKGCVDPSILERNYETECAKLRESYEVLINRIEEIRRTTSEDVLALPMNSFMRSIDVFLEAVVDATAYGREVLSEEPVSYKSILDVSICHDCFTQTYEILSDNEVFILGDIEG